MENKIENLRAHHLLCLRSYQGKGYSHRFVANTDNFVKRANSSPDFQIKTVVGRDSLCLSCPSMCKEAQTSNLDKLVIELLKIRDGGIYMYSKLMQKLFKVMTPEKHKEICGECQWWHLCKDAFKKVKR